MSIYKCASTLTFTLSNVVITNCYQNIAKQYIVCFARDNKFYENIVSKEIFKCAKTAKNFYKQGYLAEVEFTLDLYKNTYEITMIQAIIDFHLNDINLNDIKKRNDNNQIVDNQNQ